MANRHARLDIGTPGKLVTTPKHRKPQHLGALSAVGVVEEPDRVEVGTRAASVSAASVTSSVFPPAP